MPTMITPVVWNTCMEWRVKAGLKMNGDDDETKL